MEPNVDDDVSNFPNNGDLEIAVAVKAGTLPQTQTRRLQLLTWHRWREVKKCDG
ncbi:hypothetical protein RYX36_013180 [Vicia faba]